MNGIPRRILEEISLLTLTQRQWIGIRGLAQRIPCGPQNVLHHIRQLEADGYLVLEVRGAPKPTGFELTPKALEYLASLHSPGLALAGQIADLV